MGDDLGYPKAVGGHLHPAEGRIEIAKDSGEIEQRFNMIDSALNRLDGLSSTLRVQLDVILKPSYPKETKMDREVAEMSPMAHRLDAIYDQLDSICDRFIDIESRIAL